MAADYDAGETPGFLDEIRLGVMYHDLHVKKRRQEKGVDFNGEILFAKPDWRFDNVVADFILRPRLVLGGAINTSGRTSQAYLQLNWSTYIYGPVFGEVAFGPAIHSGKLKGGLRNWRGLGCRVLFRSTFNLGFDVSENLRVMATYDHISNANLCSPNSGLSTIGARIGYKF
jgi:lipid A 3-O-deacylase